MTLTNKLDRLPPIFCRGLAKKNGRLASDAELRRRTGWGDRRLCEFYRSLTWANATVGDIDTFLAACGIRWSSTRRQRWLFELAVKRGGIQTMRHIKCTRPEVRMAYIRNLETLLAS